MHIGTWDIGMFVLLFVAATIGCRLGVLHRRRKAQRNVEVEKV